jgi:hypothetical protein
LFLIYYNFYCVWLPWDSHYLRFFHIIEVYPT